MDDLAALEAARISFLQVHADKRLRPGVDGFFNVVIVDHPDDEGQESPRKVLRVDCSSESVFSDFPDEWESQPVMKRVSVFARVLAMPRRVPNQD